MNLQSPPTFVPPTVGRVVLLMRGTPEAQATGWPVFINKVWSDRCINVAGFNEWGTQVSYTSVTLVQAGEPVPQAGPYATWMPYQVGQAAKTEELQRQLNAATVETPAQGPSDTRA